jgi:hypothetical protein
MPRVTNYGGPKVEQRALPGVRATAAPDANALGGAIGNKMLAAGAEMYADEVRKQDEIAVLEADRRMSEWEVKRLYDPKEGALTKRGKDAFGLPDVVGKELDDTIGEIRGSLTNDRQRMAFERRASARKSDINTALSRHVFAEVRKHDDAETENYLANAHEAAVANFGNPERIGLEIERQRAAVQQYAQRNGLGPEYVKQKLASVEANTHAAVIDRMLANGQDQTAKQYFDTVREALGASATKVEAKMQVAITEGEGMRAADETWRTLGPKSDADPINVDAMAEAIRTKFANDPGKLKTAMAHLKERAALFNTAQRERDAARESVVWRQVYEGGNIASIARTPEFLALPGAKQEQVRAYLVRDAEHKADRAYMLGQRARARENDADTDATRKGFASYLTYSNPATLNEMSEEQIIALLPSLGRTLTGQLMEKKRSLAKGSEKLHEATIDQQLFESVAESAGLRPFDPKKTEDERANLGRLRNAVEIAIDADQRQAGKPATRERKQQIMTELVDRRVKLDVFGRDPERVAATLKADERDRAYVPIESVPAQTQAEAINYLRSLGRVPVGMDDKRAIARFQDRIQRAYAQRLLGANRAQIETILKGD